MDDIYIPDGEVIEKLLAYARLLAEANERARLTGARDSDTIYKRHICDAFAAVPYLPPSARFIDVGTGGGLPGLVLAICRPDTTAVLLDSIGKKSRLLAEISEKLGCGNVTVVNSRSEDYAATNRETFDVALARAVTAAPILAEYLSPLVRVGGTLLTFKSASISGEIAGKNLPWERLGLSEIKLERYKKPLDDETVNYIVTWKKIKSCPKGYPRRPGTAEKEPWFNSVRR